jgi:hypothetical protein
MYSFYAEYSYGMMHYGELLVGENFSWNLKYATEEQRTASC